MKRFAYLPIIVLFSSLLLSACATAPKVAIMEPEVTAHILGQVEIERLFGSDFLRNPYIVRKGLFTGFSDELVVVELKISLPEAARVSFEATAQAEGGASPCRSLDSNEMIDFTSQIKSFDPVDVQSRTDAVYRSYLPSESFVCRKGTTTYLLALLGKYPIPRPTIVTLRADLQDLDPILIALNLPALPEAKK
ncbi:MAG: hypothetical protein WCQ50_14990 [Spirochaetota bacterium]